MIRQTPGLTNVSLGRRGSSRRAAQATVEQDIADSIRILAQTMADTIAWQPPCPEAAAIRREQMATLKHAMSVAHSMADELLAAAH